MLKKYLKEYFLWIEDTSTLISRSLIIMSSSFFNFFFDLGFICASYETKVNEDYNKIIKFRKKNLITV